MAITKLGNRLLRSIAEQTAALGGAGAGYLVSKGANKLLGKGFVKAVQANRLSPEESERLAKNMLGNKKVSIVQNNDPWKNGYSPAMNIVQAAKQSNVLAHELGHATGLLGKNPVVGQAAAEFTYRLGSGAGGVRAVEAASRAFREAKGMAPSKADAMASKASQLATAAQLAEEAQASIRGVKAIYDLKGKDAAIQAAKDLLPGYGTYVANAVGSHVVAPAVAKRLGKYFAMHVE